MMEQRRKLATEIHTLPSRYWEPEPDAEDLARMEREYNEQYSDDEEAENFVKTLDFRGQSEYTLLNWIKCVHLHIISL